MKLMCFGDSNTWGYDPCSYLGSRYDRGWVELLGKKIGRPTVNRGLNGREIPEESMLIPADVSLFIVMLGTNDLLQGCSAVETAERMADFLRPMAGGNILLIAPPPLTRGEWVADDELIRESQALAAYYRSLSEELGIAFADAGTWNIPLCFDGVHFTEEGHRLFAEELYRFIKENDLC